MVDVNRKQRETAKQIDVQIAHTIGHDGQPDNIREASIIAEQATGTLWRRWAGRAGLIAAAAGLLVVGGGSHVEAASQAFCASFHDIVLSDTVATQATARLRRGGGLVVIAIGSSSTKGVGASSPDRSYPALVQRLLRGRFPGLDIVIHNRGIGGQLASQMVARFDTDIWPLHPDLVLWQTGTIEALRHTSPDALRDNLRDGVERMRRHGAEVVLVDQQYSATLEKRNPDYPRYVEVVRKFARASRVPLIDRYAAMRRRRESAATNTNGLLAPDRLHLNDDGYRCLARVVADFIACGKRADCPDGRALADSERP